jgi:hypothetical protein
MSDAYKTTGTKGSDVYDSTGSSLLDLSIRLVRGADAKEIRERIGWFASFDSRGSRARLVDAFVLAFHTRNVRGGKGERDLFQALFLELYKCHPMDAVRVLTLIPKYGCWRDLFELATLSLEKGADCGEEESLMLVKLRHDIVGIVGAQLRDDLRVANGGEGALSLCAKWAPRERDVLAKYVAQALVESVGAEHPVCLLYSATMRYYRKALSLINKALGTVEVPMAAGAWASIKPSAVPGRAGALYKRAFLNLPSTWVCTPDPKGKLVGKHVTPAPDGVRKPDDEDRVTCASRFKAHFAKAAKGLAKVHGADTLFPHEVVRKATNTLPDTAEGDHLQAVWRSMVAKAKEAGGLGRSIFMSDFSGSMQSAGVAGDPPYWVSMALGLLGAEVCADEFKDRLMTFDSNPTWHTFSPEDDLFQRICSITHSRCGQGLSTDFQKAMDLVLATLKEKRMRPGQEPENLIVLTDMAFDAACGSSELSDFTGHSYSHVVKTAPWETHIAMIQESFRRAGEDMWGAGQGFKPPRIVIWNLAADPKDIHAKADQPGVAMLSGWSPSQFKVLCEAGPQPLTPLDILRIELDDPQYDAVREALRGEPASSADFDSIRWGGVGRL